MARTERKIMVKVTMVHATITPKTSGPSSSSGMTPTSLRKTTSGEKTQASKPEAIKRYFLLRHLYEAAHVAMADPMMAPTTTDMMVAEINAVEKPNMNCARQARLSTAKQG